MSGTRIAHRPCPDPCLAGPSAGLMFTLTIYNLITVEDLTDGRWIVGTETIDLQEAVGLIGGHAKGGGGRGSGYRVFSGASDQCGRGP